MHILATSNSHVAGKGAYLYVGLTSILLVCAPTILIYELQYEWCNLGRTSRGKSGPT